MSAIVHSRIGKCTSIGDRDVQTRAVGKRSVDEGLTDVDPPTGGLQHPLDEVAHRRVTETQSGPLRHAFTGDMHVSGAVEPDLLDLGIVQQRLQRSEPAERRQHVTDAGGFVFDEAAAACESSVIVTTHLRVRDAPRGVGIDRGIHPFRAQATPDLLGDQGTRMTHPGILATIGSLASELSTGTPAPGRSGVR